MKTKLLILAIILTSLISCVSFDRKMIKDDFIKLNDENLNELNGKYQFSGYQNISPSRTKSDKSRSISEMLSVDKKYNTSYSHCEVNIEKNKKSKNIVAKFKFFKNDSLGYSFQYNAKISNGILILKNNTTHCDSLPYLLGGCRTFQSSIGLTKEKNLWIQDFFTNDGAFIFFFWAGYTINYTEKFEKIN